MRTLAQLTAVAIMLAFAASGQAQQTATDSSAQAKPPAATSAQSSTAPPAPAQDSLAEAARKARERRKEESKTPRVFTNENIPTSGGISSVGAPAESSSGEGTGTAKPAASSGSGEQFWRDKFAALRHKLEQDKENADVSQRELGTLSTQFYSDPNQQMQQQLTRSDINKKTAEIDKAKAQVDADQQAISDAEDDLRKSGGDPGWAR